MDSFNCIWQLLAPQGEYCRRMRACRQLWDSFDLEKQKTTYRTIHDKLAAGEFVSENPYYAIYDNAYPPRKKQQQIMSYADYYAKYGTTEERDGWHMANPTGQRVIYVKK